MTRKPRTARPSRLSLQARVAQLQQQNEDYRDALETIADILEDVGILEPESEEEEPYIETGLVEKNYKIVIPEELQEPTAEEEKKEEDPQPQ